MGNSKASEFVPRGIIPAVVTPLDDEGRFNEAGMRRLLDYLIEGGSHGLFVVGAAGEFYGFDPEEKRRIFEVTMDQVGGRVPVYAGTNGITTRESIELTMMAEECGVDAVSVLTPMFINPSQEQLVEHFTAIARATSLPVIMYNNPPKTGAALAASTVAKLAEIPNIVGIKDSSGDLTQTGEFIRLTRGKPGFSVLMGRDTLIFGALCYGATGSIASCANVAPRICADIYDRYKAGDMEGALDAQYRLAPLRIAFNLGAFPAVIKEGLQMLGIDAGPCAAPVGPLKPEERAELRRVLFEMGLLAASEGAKNGRR